MYHVIQRVSKCLELTKNADRVSRLPAPANQKRLIAERREAREAAEREKMMQEMAAERLAGLKQPT